jgi:DNA ligase (NAD+)
MRDAKAILAELRQQDAFEAATLDLSIPETQLLIDKADAIYHRSGGSTNGRALMTDAEYDRLRNHLKILAPDDYRLTRVGSPYNAEEISNKVKHSIPMGSLDNTDDGILGYDPWVEWVRNKLRESIPEEPVNGINILASLKIDGGSICATYKKGVLTCVATRGNGEYGEDITANAANFQFLPTVLPYPIDAEVRGEAILYKKDFNTVCQSIAEEDRSNPRNVGNGILGRHDGLHSEYIRFLAFNLYLGESSLVYGTEEEKLAALKQLGFTPVPHKLCKNSDEFHAFYSSIVDGRDKLPFEIDGIVVVVNNLVYQAPFITSDVKSVMRPKYARAVKFPHKSNITTLESVEVTVGHTRAIIPTAKFKSVRIGGVNVDSALLNNYDEIARLGLAIGDEVEVILAGEIIPKVLRRVTAGPSRQPIIEPTACPVCGSPTSRLCRGRTQTRRSRPIRPRGRR